MDGSGWTESQIETQQINDLGDLRRHYDDLREQLKTLESAYSHREKNLMGAMQELDDLHETQAVNDRIIGELKIQLADKDTRIQELESLLKEAKGMLECVENTNVRLGDAASDWLSRVEKRLW